MFVTELSFKVERAFYWCKDEVSVDLILLYLSLATRIIQSQRYTSSNTTLKQQLIVLIRVACSHPF